MLSSLGSFEHFIGFNIFRNAATGEAICRVLLNMKQNKFYFSCLFSGTYGAQLNGEVSEGFGKMGSFIYELGAECSQKSVAIQKPS